MELITAITALSALAHPGRLRAFRVLVQAGPEGMAAGEIARATDSMANTLSTSLNRLAGAGLVSSRRKGRSIIYTAGYQRMRELLTFLMEDCCAGDPEICAPLSRIVNQGGAEHAPARGASTPRSSHAAG